MNEESLCEVFELMLRFKKRYTVYVAQLPSNERRFVRPLTLKVIEVSGQFLKLIGSM